MNLLFCLARPSGEPVPEDKRRLVERHRCFSGADVTWHDFGAFAALTCVDPLVGFGPGVAKWHDLVGVGMVRLDNRAQVAEWAGCPESGSSDIELLTRLVAIRGDLFISKVLGDFAVIFWNSAARTVMAACDVFAVKKLYYAEHADLLTLSSRAEVLAIDENYEVQYLVERLAYCEPTSGLTAFAGVRQVPAATVIQWKNGHAIPRLYWSPRDFEPTCYREGDDFDRVSECRDLLKEAVRLRSTGKGDTWSTLSGGLDSSAVVSMAQWLAARGVVSGGLGGTITWVDSHGTGADEREYSDAVVQQYGVRNEKVIDSELWEDDVDGPPLLDQPVGGVPLYVRERQTINIIRSAGGRVLLTGMGGDNLFTGNMLFFADWISKGRWAGAVRELAHRAAMGRVSFWELAYKNAFLPLLPFWLRQRLAAGLGGVPSWIPRTLARRYGLNSRTAAVKEYSGRKSHKYFDAVADGINAIPNLLLVSSLDEQLDVRHPYLYRPLVEFALTLGPDMCARPLARKWVLREATRGILPEKIRGRVGKGLTYGLMAWSVVKQRTRLEAMLRQPILAELGCLDACELRSALRTAQYEPHGAKKTYADVQHALTIEAWLQMRSGRWLTRDKCRTTQLQ